VTVCGNRIENLKAELDRYKAALEKITELKHKVDFSEYRTVAILMNAIAENALKA
jgi:cell fate regulator YaaT (PSP1 superfamily)